MQGTTEVLHGLAHRTVRCTTGQCPMHQGASARTLHLRVSQAQLCYNSPDCPVRHRTVSSAPPEQQLSARNGRLCKVNSGIQMSEQRVRGAPDCPVPHEDRASNGRQAPCPNDRMTWRHTGHCPVRPSPAAFSNGYIWLVAINTSPTDHFKVWESKQHSKSSS
jgi:hypothetical protein